MSVATTQRVPTGTYELDAGHSSFGFAVKHNGVSTFRGRFGDVEARLEDGVLVGTAKAESIDVPIADLKAHLLSPEFFNVAETPTVTFRSTAIRIADDGSVEVDGDLEIRGIARPVTAVGTYASGVGMSGAEVVGFELEATIDRREYGLDWQADLPSGGEVLAWDVVLEVHLELAKKD
jgi:polyisoprenoid-binding protein YceI